MSERINQPVPSCLSCNVAFNAADRTSPRAELSPRPAPRRPANHILLVHHHVHRVEHHRPYVPHAQPSPISYFPRPPRTTRASPRFGDSGPLTHRVPPAPMTGATKDATGEKKSRCGNLTRRGPNKGPTGALRPGAKEGRLVWGNIGKALPKPSFPPAPELTSHPQQVQKKAHTVLIPPRQ